MPHPTPPDQSHPDPSPARGRFWAVAAVLAGVFLGWAIPLWGIGFMRGRGAFDQHYYHILAIRRFAQQWPAVDLSRYESATAPGYHLVLAGLSRMAGDRALTLQIAASLFTIALFCVIAGVLARAARGRGVSTPETCALALPIACSMYVVFPGVWLQPDNAAWLGVCAILALAMPARRGFGWLFAGGAILAALVFVRQNHLWAAAVLWGAAWLNATPVQDGRLGTLFRSPARRASAMIVAALCTLPAFGIVAWLFRLWGGAVPPDFQNQHASGPNWATPAFALALIAIYSVFLFAWLAPALARLWRESRPLVLASALAGGVIAALSPTTFSREPRSSGLWNLTLMEERFGLIIAGHTSPLMVALSALGAVALLGWLSAVRARERWLLIATLAAFLAAQTANSNCWQRYFEPLLLLLMAVMALLGRAAADDPRTGPILAPGRILGPVALALALAAVTVHGLLTGEILRW